MNKQIIDSINRNRYIVYFDNIGIDVAEIKDEVLENFSENEFEKFINRSHQLLSPNVCLDSIVFMCVFKLLHSKYKGSMVFDNELKLDVKTVIATSQSLIQRPCMAKPSELKEGFKEPAYEDGFRVISRFERELSENHYGVRGKNKGGVIFEGLLPYEVETNPLVEKLASNHIWTNSYYRGVPVIQGFNSSINSMETQCVLWMNSQLLDILGLKIDCYRNGLMALDVNNEIVLKFRCWRDNLIGNGSSFVGIDSNIAKLEGSDLILREDYFNRLKEIIPSVVYYSKVLKFNK